MNLLPNAPSAILISTGEWTINMFTSPHVDKHDIDGMKRVTRLVILHALTTQFSHHQSLAPFRLDECASQSMNSRAHRVLITGMSGCVTRKGDKVPTSECLAIVYRILLSIVFDRCHKNLIKFTSFLRNISPRTEFAARTSNERTKTKNELNERQKKGILCVNICDHLKYFVD